jgi:hypothetical protein
MMKFWKSGEAAKTPAKPTTRKKQQPEVEARMNVGAFLLTPLGGFLSGCSLLWTAFSVTDLLGIGPMGLTVALTLDLIWLVIMYATHKEIPFYGSLTATQAIGWIFLVVVVVALAWHGVSLEGKEILGYTVSRNASHAMAIIGPILPLGSKITWVLVSAAYKKAEQEANNPEGYTEEQLIALEEMERESKFEEAEAEKALEAKRRKHKLELEEIRMGGEKTRARNDVNFELERARIEQATKLRNEMPVDLVRIIQGEVEQPVLPAQAQAPALMPVRTIPAAKERERTEVTVSITDLNEDQRKARTLVVEYLLLKQKDPTYSQRKFAADKGISSGWLNKLITRYGPSIENDELSDGDEAITG